ncbi:MAG TPA: hypothetical protein V6C81_18200 [Planktothrix sp.]|jgi:hypothetical protein
MVQKGGDVNDQATQVDQSAERNGRVAAQGRDGAYGPQQRLTPGDHPGPTQHSGYHVDDMGRVDSITNESGQTTKLQYAPDSSQVQGFTVTDQSGKVLQKAQREKSGGFNVGGAEYKDVRAGRNGQLQLVDKDNISHERLLGGNSVAANDSAPRAADKSRVVTREVSHDGSTEYQWSQGTGRDGKPVSQMDNYVVRDQNHNIKEFGVRRPDGRYLTFHLQKGQQKFDEHDVARMTKEMRNNPDHYPMVMENGKEVPLLQNNLDTDGIDSPQMVTVGKDGQRIARFVNGEMTATTDNGDCYRTHVDGRHSKTVRLADGQPHLSYTESRDPETGNRASQQFSYDQQGQLNQWTETQHNLDQSGREQDVTHTYKKVNDQWVDETGRPAGRTPIDNADGSVSISDGRTMHNYNDDGSELFKSIQADQKWRIDKEFTSCGGVTKIGYDKHNVPNDIQYTWPGANGSQPIQEHLQKLHDSRTGDYWTDTSVRGSRIFYGLTPHIDDQGTISYARNNQVIRQDDPRDNVPTQQNMPQSENTPPPRPRYNGAQRMGYDPSQSVWNPTDDPSLPRYTQQSDVKR